MPPAAHRGYGSQRAVQVKAIGIGVALLLSSFPLAATDWSDAVCFGNEPSWSLQFAGPRKARLSFPDGAPSDWTGVSTELPVLRERAWRGQPAKGGGTLVAFLKEEACSDTMSDIKHPVQARVSLPDGRFLAGCCRIPQGKAGPALEGTTWKLAAAKGIDVDLANAEQPVTARFEGGRVQAFSGCNRIMGGYKLDAERLVIESLATTMMACPEPVMRLENALTPALAGSFRVALAQGSLTLTSDTGAVLIFSEEAPPKFEGVRWQVTGYNNGRQAVVSPLVGTKLSVAFQDGSVGGFAGCNTFRGPYRVDASRIAIGPLAATRKACLRADLMQQEREFLAALTSATTWAIEQGMLDMHRGDGERVLTAADRPE